MALLYTGQLLTTDEIFLTEDKGTVTLKDSYSHPSILMKYTLSKFLRKLTAKMSERSTWWRLGELEINIYALTNILEFYYFEIYFQCLQNGNNIMDILVYFFNFRRFINVV